MKTRILAVGLIIVAAVAGAPAPGMCLAAAPADHNAFITASTLPDDAEAARIAEINRLISENGYHWTAGKTSVSGLSDAEKKMLLGFVPPPDGWFDGTPPYRASARPTQVTVFDWRERGAITPVKDQGTCGACWAFAAIGQMEAHILIYDGRIEDLSEQHVIDCNALMFNCDGGWHWTALELLRDAGAVRELCYPYEGDDGHACRQAQCRIVARLERFAPLQGEQCSTDEIKQALLDGPVSSAI